MKVQRYQPSSKKFRKRQKKLDFPLYFADGISYATLTMTKRTETPAAVLTNSLTIDEKHELINQVCSEHNLGGWMYFGNFDISDDELEAEWTKTVEAVNEAHGGAADVTDLDIAALIVYGLERCALELD